MNKELISTLRAYNELNNEKAECEKGLSESVDTYVHRLVTEPKKRATDYVAPPSRSALTKILIWFIITLCAALTCLIISIILIVKMSVATSIANNPGDKFYDWIDGWQYVSTFDELEGSWAEVRSDWKSRGLDIDWKYVENIKNKEYLNYDYINADGFASSLLYNIRQEYNKSFVIGACIMAVIIFGFSALAIGSSVKRATDEYKKESAVYNTYLLRCADDKQYNEQEYPSLHSEYLRRKEMLEKEYFERRERLQNDLDRIDTELRPYYEIVPKSNAPLVSRLLEIFEFGRADTLDEAMSILYLDLKEEAEERRRREEEREREMEIIRHNMAMETYARQQAMAAENAAKAAHDANLAQERAMRDEQARAKAAQRDAEHKAHFRCLNCQHRTKCYQRGAINCASYLPK